MARQLTDSHAEKFEMFASFMFRPTHIARVNSDPTLARGPRLPRTWPGRGNRRRRQQGRGWAGSGLERARPTVDGAPVNGGMERMRQFRTLPDAMISFRSLPRSGPFWQSCAVAS